MQLADVFVWIEDPRQAAKVERNLVELLVVAVAAVLAGADTLVEIEIWAEEKLDWFRRYLPLVHGIASHDIFGRMFGLIEPGQFEAAFRRWMQGVLPALDAQVVAIDGKTGVPSDRSSSLGWKTGAPVTYGEVRLAEELQFSVYNFELADVGKLWEHFNLYEAEARSLLDQAGVLFANQDASPVEKRRFPLLATYELALKCSHLFNLLDARGAISVTERVGVIGRIRALAVGVAKAYALQQTE